MLIFDVINPGFLKTVHGLISHPDNSINMRTANKYTIGPHARNTYPQVPLLSLNMNVVILALLTITTVGYGNPHQKRALQRSHEKPQAEKWLDRFMGVETSFDHISSLVQLLDYITETQLKDCTPVILYDTAVETSHGLLLEQLFRNYPIAYTHGQITTDYKIRNQGLLRPFDNKCVTYMMFMADVMRCREVIGVKSIDKVVVVARSSQWRVYEFLASAAAQSFVNLLVVAQSEKAGNTLVVGVSFRF